MSKKPKRLKEVIRKFDALDYNKPNKFGEEMDDHINISLASETKLGRFLDPSYSDYFNYLDYGNFRSPLNLAYWLRDPDKDDRLRYLKKKDINQLAKVKGYPRLKNHLLHILLATAIRLRNRPQLIKEVKSLPKDIKILSYRKQPKSNIRITTGYANIIVPVVEEIFNSIWEERPLNMEAFITTKDPFVEPFKFIVDIEDIKKDIKREIDEKGVEVGNDKISVMTEDGEMVISPEGIEFNK